MNANAGSFAAEADGAPAEYLFVQTFDMGTWAPKNGEVGIYTLTLTGAAAQTVYFSDRPERIVGTLPTAAFLDGLGFTPANPPNAALVAQTEAGEEIVVVELFDPVYTESFDGAGGVTLVYEARVLDEYAEDGLAHLAKRADQGETRPDARFAATFGPASLFIDDCPDATFYCLGPGPRQELGVRGLCWNWSNWLCEPCVDHRGECNAAFPDFCSGRCADCWDGIYGTCLG